MAENVIATNFHVIDGSTEAKIKLVGDDQIQNVSGVVAVNRHRDLVLLQVSNVRGAPLRLASATQPEVGEEVYACGNPGGLEGTISPGIVSSVATRRIEGEDLIQITAPISPGSSGGPLVNKRGEVIGVTEASLSEGQNLNFAVPVLYLALLLREIGPAQPLSSVTSPRRSPGEGSPTQARDEDVCGDTPFTVGVYDEAEEYIYVGRRLLNDKVLYDQAKEAFKRAIRLEPKNAVAYYELSIAYQRLRCFKQALIAGQQASILKPKEPLYRLGVSKYLLQLGRHDEAISVLKEGIKEKPNYGDFYVMLGGEYIELKRYSEAMNAFQSAVKFQPKNASAHHFLGLMYVVVNDRDGAAREYDVLRKLDAAMAEDLREAILKKFGP